SSMSVSTCTGEINAFTIIASTNWSSGDGGLRRTFLNRSSSFDIVGFPPSRLARPHQPQSELHLWSRADNLLKALTRRRIVLMQISETTVANNQPHTENAANRPCILVEWS